MAEQWLPILAARNAINSTVDMVVGRVIDIAIERGENPHVATKAVVKILLSVAASHDFAGSHAAKTTSDRDLFLIECAKAFDECADINARIKAKPARRAHG